MDPTEGFFLFPASHSHDSFTRQRFVFGVNRIKTLRSLLWATAIAFWLLGCDSGPSAPDPPGLECTRGSGPVTLLSSATGSSQTSEVRFHKLLECDVSEVTGFPSGLAVTPDGRWLISLGFSKGTVTLRNAETLEVVAGPKSTFPCPTATDPMPLCGSRDSISLAHPHGVEISPDGEMAILTNRNGVIGLNLPSLKLRFNPTMFGIGSSRHIVRDRTGENYYVSGEVNGIARLSASGKPLGLFDDAEITTAMSLTRTGGELLVVTDNGRRLVILDTPHLDLVRSIDLPFEGQVVVPLRDAGKAIIVGGRREAERHP